MDNIIVAYVDSMGLTQKVQLPGEQQIDVPSESFAESVVALCAKNNVYKVHLFGNIHFLEGVSQEIVTKEKELFSKNNIEIEVN